MAVIWLLNASICGPVEGSSAPTAVPQVEHCTSVSLRLSPIGVNSASSKLCPPHLPHGVLFTTHDPNHAVRAADRACLLRQGAVIGEGAARDVLTLDNLSALYGANIQRLTDAGGDQAFMPE